MEASLHYFSPSSLPLLKPSKTLVSQRKIIPTLQTSTRLPIKLTALPTDTSTVDYSSTNSVFPAEACETIGGDACAAEMFPEVKPKPQAKSNATATPSETVDREYLEYNNPKTVFPGEACDDLGGEFCEPEYQSGVH